MKDRSLAQTLALLFGIAFLGAGILGFIPGITTNLGDIEFAGNDSPAELLGIFQVSILHNIVHLLFGVVLALSRTHAGSLSFLLWGGVIYLVLFLYGLFIDKDSDGNFVPVNTADNWLHLLLGAGLLGGWFISKGAREGATDRLYNDADAAGRVALEWMAASASRRRPPPAHFHPIVLLRLVDSDRQILEHLEPHLRETEPDRRHARPRRAGLRRPRRGRTRLRRSGGHCSCRPRGRPAARALARRPRGDRARCGPRRSGAAELAAALRDLRATADELPEAANALDSLLSDGDRAWRALAAALLADELTDSSGRTSLSSRAALLAPGLRPQSRPYRIDTNAPLSLPRTIAPLQRATFGQSLQRLPQTGSTSAAPGRWMGR